MKRRYRYEGPVLECDHLICLKWKEEVIASNQSEAKNRLGKMFKKKNNRDKNARIMLPAKLKELEAIL